MKKSMYSIKKENDRNKDAGCNLRSLEKSKLHPHFRQDITNSIFRGWSPEECEESEEDYNL